MPTDWMPGATRLDIGDHAPTDGGPAKALAHITWDRNATAKAPAALVPYENLRDYFGKNSAGKAVAPHILWDPFTGRITQFVPASSRSKSLADSAGGTRTNRAGSVVIQVEALFFPYCVVGGKTYARLADTPCKGWAELRAWVRSWGVPDAWPMGRPTDFTPHRSEAIWGKSPGWYAHAHVPENDHQDPGSWPAFTIEEDPMAGMTKRDIYDAVWKTDAIPGPADAADHKTNPNWQPQSVIKDVQARIRSMDKRLSAQTAAITALAKLAGGGADTKAIVAAVEKAIESAVIDVNINTTPEG
ncbi:hypothetical protein [Streptomyces sp. BE230]|uniref:hypothetical protein n=1 Tax=Streptomyces sp. BE230 TaxID=3002526 RepID=UPI002ED4C96D|nr:hypothetical protein [Streptomyces sp. BE230]